MAHHWLRIEQAARCRQVIGAVLGSVGKDCRRIMIPRSADSTASCGRIGAYAGAYFCAKLMNSDWNGPIDRPLGPNSESQGMVEALSLAFEKRRPSANFKKNLTSPRAVPYAIASRPFSHRWAVVDSGYAHQSIPWNPRPLRRSCEVGSGSELPRELVIEDHTITISQGNVVRLAVVNLEAVLKRLTDIPENAGE